MEKPNPIGDLFILFMLELFTQYQDSINVVAMLKSCCDLFKLDPSKMQRIALTIMTRAHSEDDMKINVAQWMYSRGMKISDIMKVTKRSRAQTYRIIATPWAPWSAPLYFNDFDLIFIKDFLNGFTKLGGILP